MFCKKCGAKCDGTMICPVCGESVFSNGNQEDVTKNEKKIIGNEINDIKIPFDNDSAYKTAAKKYWYCFLFPILFFIPVLNNNKNIPGNKDVASAALWIFIVGVALSSLGTVLYGSNIQSLASLMQIIFSCYVIYLIVYAICGKAKRIFKLDEIKIFK